ncbi:outer membrane beta-barrel protein [Flavihumibacter rivuli]|uniref:porin n=1 Tax=Flavihumibacter rivuli TaxID=2838156 RepID=UPI001BDE04D9|nr:porin [Flavihumibacter rivuli]ULQ56820.1 outer membrane beta-barrel protein [Flavihumibacter rivuli]
MPKLLLVVVGICLGGAIMAQKQTDTSTNYFKPIIPVDKAKLLKNVDMIANMQFAQRNEFEDGKHTESRFAMNQFRLEIRGKVHEKVSFRFRDRYTRDVEPQSVDNLSRSTDMAYIGIELSKKWSIAAGKMCADWGGYEFDLNPIDIYEYNDIVEYADNFLTGVQASYAVNDQHSFTVQWLNSRTKSFDELYGQVPGVEEAKFPSAIVLNWRGSFGGKKFTTLWSYSAFQEASGKYMHYIALGNQLNLEKFQATYDFKWSDEDLDRKTIVSSIIPDDIFSYAASDVRYVEHWLKLDYLIHPRVNLSLVGMVSDAYWYGNPDPNADSKLRTSWGLIPTVEYMPFNDLNLKFFLNYVWRSYDYTGYAETNFASVDKNTSRISIGFSSPLKIF